MLRKKYVTLTLHDISSLPKINNFKSRELEIICTVLLLKLGKAGERIISHFTKNNKKRVFVTYFLVNVTYF